MRDLSSLTSGRARLAAIVDSDWFSMTITALVVLNALLLGLDAIRGWPEPAHRWFGVLDRLFLAIFVVELSLKLVVHGPQFFRRAWNCFDFLVVAASLAPNGGALSILRALRVLRSLRLLSVIPILRHVVEALVKSIPGMGAIVAVLLVFFYVGAVISTTLFGDSSPALFGTLSGSFLTLFQIMTLDGWGDAVREVMQHHPSAWVFFMAFTVVTSFAILNLFIAVIVDSLQAAQKRLQEAEIEHLDEEIESIEVAQETQAAQMKMMMEEMRQLRAELSAIRSVVERRNARRGRSIETAQVLEAAASPHAGGDPQPDKTTRQRQ